MKKNCRERRSNETWLRRNPQWIQHVLWLPSFCPVDGRIKSSALHRNNRNCPPVCWESRWYWWYCMEWLRVDQLTSCYFWKITRSQTVPCQGIVSACIQNKVWSCRNTKGIPEGFCKKVGDSTARNYQPTPSKSYDRCQQFYLEMPILHHEWYRGALCHVCTTFRIDAIGCQSWVARNHSAVCVPSIVCDNA